jgi:putative oxidoreductase
MKKILDTQPLDVNLATLALRLTVGGLFVYYGYSKLANYDQILPMFGDIIGIGPKLSFNLVIFAELFCGIFVTLGFCTRLSIIPIFITMTVAFFIAHANDPFTSKAPSFIFWCLSFVIFILGSGRYSVDNLIGLAARKNNI